MYIILFSPHSNAVLWILTVTEVTCFMIQPAHCDKATLSIFVGIKALVILAKAKHASVLGLDAAILG